MSCVLNIETSTKVCSVALSNNGKILFSKENRDGVSHAELLGVFVQDAVSYACQHNLKIEAVAVSSGPGSYTGLRIGISEAKGFCYGAGIPLIAIPTLEILTNRMIRFGFESDYYCPMIDARRMEVYAAIYDKKMNKIRDVSADIIDENSYLDFLSKGKVLFFGDGSEKCKQVIRSENSIFIENVFLSAVDMVSISERKFEKGEFENIAYFEPFYLKDFMATKAKNKVIKN